MKIQHEDTGHITEIPPGTEIPRRWFKVSSSSSAPCSSCVELTQTALKVEMRYQESQKELKRLRRHLRDLEQSLVDVREELENEGNAYRIIPLSHEDSGVVLAVCESIGPTLIPVTPWSGSMHLCPKQLDQLSDAMAEFSQTND